MKRRQFFLGCGGTLAVSYAIPTSKTHVDKSGIGPLGQAWPAWPVFQAQFVTDEGRVVDNSDGKGQTVSEAQAYALFFALLANDRRGFERILKWTEDNLCQGDLSARLPARRWGEQSKGTWGVLDSNAASDADLWLAYALGEAGRLWGVARYVALSQLVSARVLRTACVELPNLGLTLLPGPKGFALETRRWRLNASYSPPHLLQWLATQHGAQSGWQRVATTSAKVIVGSAPNGWASDWVLYDAKRGFLVDAEGSEQAFGAYNAIRVYMWVGMMHPEASGRQRLLQALQPMVKYVAKNGLPPQSVHALTGESTKAGPAGFSAALLPFLHAQQDITALQTQRQRILARPVSEDVCYEQVLSLFANGFMDGVYRFSADGQVQPRWAGRGALGVGKHHKNNA